MTASLRARGFSPVEQLAAAAWTFSQSSRNGSMIVGRPAARRRRAACSARRACGAPPGRGRAPAACRKSRVRLPASRGARPSPNSVSSSSVDLDRNGLVEQTAVEFLDVFLDGRRIAAFVHGREEIVRGKVEAIGLALVLFDQFDERAFRQQSDILREHCEDAAHEEFRDFEGPFALEADRPMASGAPSSASFSRAAQRCLASPRPRASRDRERADHPTPPSVVPARWGSAGPPCRCETHCGRGTARSFSLAGEVGIKLDDVSDIDHDEERRPFVERARVVLRLFARGTHERVPGGKWGRLWPSSWRAAAPDHHTAALTALEREGELFVDFATFLAFFGLLGFQHEATPLVEVDAAGRGRAVVMAETDGALEDVVVLLGFGAGRVGRAHADQVAQFHEEQSVVRPFRAAVARGPARDEGIDL